MALNSYGAIKGAISGVFGYIGRVGDALNTNEQTLPPGGDSIRNVQQVERRNTYQSMVAQATLVVANAEAVLGNINICGPTASSVVTVYDGLTAGGGLIAVIDASVTMSYTFDVLCSDGITIVMSGANSDISVSWR